MRFSNSDVTVISDRKSANRSEWNGKVRKAVVHSAPALPLPERRAAARFGRGRPHGGGEAAEYGRGGQLRLLSLGVMSRSHFPRYP
jgi:hypothetical protein